MFSLKSFTQSKSQRHKLSILSAAVLSMSTVTPVFAYEFDKPVEQALRFGQDENKYGQIKFDLRYRYEYANSENVRAQSANANTLRHL